MIMQEIDVQRRGQEADEESSKEDFREVFGPTQDKIERRRSEPEKNENKRRRLCERLGRENNRKIEYGDNNEVCKIIVRQPHVDRLFRRRG